MNSKDFMKELIEKGRAAGDKPVSKTIGKVKFEYGYSGFCSGHSMTSLFRPVTEPGKIDEVKAAMYDHTSKLGGRPSAIFGVRYTAPAEYCLSFEAEYGKERFVMSETEEADFNRIGDAIRELGINLNEWVWCAYESVESPTAVGKGDAGKYEIKSGERAGEMTYPKIIVPVELFASEQEARAATGNGGSGAKDNSQWSDTALKGDYPNGLSQEEQDEIFQWFTEMMNGNAYANDAENWPLPYEAKDPKGAKELKTKKFLGHEYNIETADIDVIIAGKIAF